MVEIINSSESFSNQSPCSDHGLPSGSRPNPAALLENYLQKKVNDATRKAYAHDILSFFQGRIPENVEEFIYRSNSASVQEWVNQLIRPKSQGGSGYSASTVRRRLAALRDFFEYCLDNELIKKNPANRKLIQKPSPCSLGPVHKLTLQQIIEMEKACLNDVNRVMGLRDLAIISIGFSCCIDCEETVSVSVHDFKFVNEKIILNFRSKKRGRFNSVEVDQTTKERIEDFLMEIGGLKQLYPDKGPDGQMQLPVFVSLSKRTKFKRLSLSAIRKIILNRVAEIGVYNMREFSQLLRLSGISHLFEIGWPLWRIQRHVRRVDSKTRQLIHSNLEQFDDSAAEVLGRIFEGERIDESILDSR